MYFHSISALINAFVAGAFGIFVLSRNLRDPRNRTYFVLALAVVIWSLSKFFLYTAVDGSSAIFWARSMMVGATFIPVIYLDFFLSLTGKAKEHLTALAANYAFGFLFLFLSFTPYYITGIQSNRWFEFWPKPGVLFDVFLFAWLSFVVYTTYIVYQEYRGSQGLYRLQLKYLLIGTIIGWMGGATNYPLFYNIPIYPFGNILVSVYIAIIAYTTIRHHLMGVEVIIRKSLVYAIVTSVVAGLNISIIYFVSLFIRNLTGFNTLWIIVPSIFLFVMVFQPVWLLAQAFVDRIFYKSAYDTQTVMNKFSAGLKRMFKVEEIAEFMTRAAVNTFGLDGSACYIYDEESRNYKRCYAAGKMEQLPPVMLHEDSALIKEMKESGKAVSEEELQFLMKRYYGGARISRALDDMKVLSSTVCIPGISQKKSYRLIGFLTMGVKRSEERFTAEDIDLLEALAGQSAMKIENALLYNDRINSMEKSLNTEKLASLGKATSGVAKEAKKALHFIEEFSKIMPAHKHDKYFLTELAPILFTEVEKLRILIQGVLDYSRPSVPKPEPLPLKMLTEEMLVLVKGGLKNKGISSRVSIEEALTVYADKNLMKQAFLNLFLNAIDAMEEGGTLSVSASASSGNVLVTVGDTGHGIRKDILPRIFEPFFSTKTDGTGLGLAITKKIVEENKGSVGVESAEGKGTRIMMEFRIGEQ